MRKKHPNWGGAREGAGRKPKPQQPIEPKGRGGKREGAGRKPSENPRVEHVVIATTKTILQKVQQLRDATKHDELPFNRMFDKWVEDLAAEYGIE